MDQLLSGNFEHLQPPHEVSRVPLVQFEKAVRLLDDPRVDHGFAVNLRLCVEPFGNFEPVPQRAVGGDAGDGIGET
jgi:hypothetical protein